MFPLLAQQAAELPIGRCLDELRRALTANHVVFVQAPPGAGKSTVIPLALLDEPWLAGRSVILLQPRRVATVAVASRLAELAGEPLGGVVGYRMRLEQKVSRSTRVEVITEGLLSRLMRRDPGLEGIGLLMVDEFHERSLEADLAFALAREIQSELRPDLRIVLMSATLDASLRNDRLPEAPTVRSEGRMHPVEIRYQRSDPGDALLPEMRRAIEDALADDGGGVLAFLAGVGDIRALGDLLEPRLRNRARVMQLYGEQPYSEQRRVLQPAGEGPPRVILATPIAETSLTIEGVRTVIDSGLANVPRHDPCRGLNALVRERISQDRADQRAGRAGRLGPGVCCRMWSQHHRDHDALPQAAG